jgi:hypothetical protein
MGPPQSQLSRQSPEDRLTYKTWLRRNVLFYSSVAALLVLAVFANHIASWSTDTAGDPIRTAANNPQR